MLFLIIVVSVKGSSVTNLLKKISVFHWVTQVSWSVKMNVGDYCTGVDLALSKIQITPLNEFRNYLRNITVVLRNLLYNIQLFVIITFNKGIRVSLWIIVLLVCKSFFSNRCIELLWIAVSSNLNPFLINYIIEFPLRLTIIWVELWKITNSKSIHILNPEWIF